MPDDIDDDGLKAAYQEAAEFNWTKEEFDAYIYEGMRVQDGRGVISLAELRKRDELIMGMHEKGLSTTLIAEITKLDEASVLFIIEKKGRVRY